MAKSKISPKTNGRLKKGTEVEVVEDSLEEVELTEEEEREDVAQKVADTGVLRKSLAVVADAFGLDDTYTMLAFTDKVTNCTLTMANRDFEVKVIVKDTYKQGIRQAD